TVTVPAADPTAVAAPAPTMGEAGGLRITALSTCSSVDHRECIDPKSTFVRGVDSRIYVHVRLDNLARVETEIGLSYVHRGNPAPPPPPPPPPTPPPHPLPHPPPPPARPRRPPRPPPRPRRSPLHHLGLHRHLPRPRRLRRRPHRRPAPQPRRRNRP